QRRAPIRISTACRAPTGGDDGFWVYPCEIFDVSVGGARLAVYCPPQAPLPEQFQLQLSEISHISRPCELAWRQGSEIGVRFIRQQGAPNTDEHAASLS